MKKDTIVFVGLDPHKKFHHVAYVEDGRGKTPVDYEKIAGSKSALTRFLRKLKITCSVYLFEKIEPLKRQPMTQPS